MVINVYGHWPTPADSFIADMANACITSICIGTIRVGVTYVGFKNTFEKRSFVFFLEIPFTRKILKPTSGE